MVKGAQEEKGYRGRLCEAVGCQLSYLSQVLNGKPDFTLEQSHRLNQFLLHDREEARFFLLLVQHSRAGTHELKGFLAEQLQELRTEHFDTRTRLKKDTTQISQQDQHKYYSTWFYSAVYVMLSVPELQDPRLISSRLNLPLTLTMEVIQFLEDIGLIRKEGSRFLATERVIHLGKDSEFIRRHHVNWRSQAMLSAEKNLLGDFHYSSVFAIAKKDFDRLKEIYVSAMEDARKVIRPSPEEEVYAFTLDLFRL